MGMFNFTHQGLSIPSIPSLAFPHSCVRRFIVVCARVNRAVGDGATALTWWDVGVVLGGGGEMEAAEVVKEEGNEEQCHITAARDT